MKVLKLGKMSGHEIAEWLDISYSTYRNKIDMYLERIKPFAKFIKIRGGVEILEIYNAYYTKNIESKINTMMLQEVSSNELGTISGMARKFQEEFPGVSERTRRSYFTQGRNLLFGETLDEQGKASGIAGSREYVWAIKISDYNEYRYLTPEEEKLFDGLILQVYGNLPVEKIKAAELLAEVFKDTDMSKEEYLALREVQSLDFFGEVIMKFREVTDLVLVHASRFEIERHNFELSTEEVALRD